jgi:hypothetical protein
MSLKKPTLNIARPQLNAKSNNNADDDQNDDAQNTNNNTNNNNNIIISPHDSFDNLQEPPREQILKTFFAFPKGNPMTTSEFKNCLMKKRLGELELLRDREMMISEEEEEEEDDDEAKEGKRKKKRNTTTTTEQKAEKTDDDDDFGMSEGKKLEIEKYALTQTLAGAKSRFEAERIAMKHTEAMQRVRAAKQEADAAIEKVTRLSEELKEKEEEARKTHKEERERRAASRKMDASKREERKIVVEAELSRREKERHRLVTNLKQTIAEEAEVRKKLSKAAS